ncbi:MAG TPA: hypothetical protein VKB38_03010 [Terracidiphilus sp.]|nr:hypothetical protein [Terracidiphilus sp.]
MTKLMLDVEDDASDKLSHQVVAFFLHSVIALGAWLALMLVGYALNPRSVSQSVILALSIAVPLIVGLFIARVKPEEMAGHVWLAGVIWLLIVSLWILDMPTGPNLCNQCGATEKLTRTLFSLPQPSGLIDDNGPFFGTWPAAALIGYAIGVKVALRKKAAPGGS